MIASPFDFDAPVDRRGTSSVKHDESHPSYPDADLLRLWVADMDFRAPEAVTDALRARVDHGVFGYTDPSAELASAAAAWIESHNGWCPDPGTLVVGPGVVFLIAQAVRALTQPGDAVLIQPPVYYPFARTVLANGRTLAEAPLSYSPQLARAGFEAAVAGEVSAESPYGFDPEAFEEAIVSSGARMFILCNPHNPVGRLWTSDELAVMARICARHNVFVVADEIHADFSRPGFSHASFAVAAEREGCNYLVCTSVSKTFNMAGLQLACAWVPSQSARKALEAEIEACGFFGVNPLSQAAAIACFTQGDPWLAELKAYLEQTIAWVNGFVATELPELCVVQPQGTYLLWIDCRDLGLTDEALATLVEQDAGLWVDLGTMFGSQGSGFIRINLATQRSVVQEAFCRLRDAVRAQRS